MFKKVNIYYSGFNHRVGGAYFHVINLSTGLKELGYDVNIITLDSLPWILRYIPHIVQKIMNYISFPLGFLYKQKVIKYFYKIFFKNSSDIDVFEDIYLYWKSDSESIVILHALWSDNLQAFHVTNRQRVKLEMQEVRIINNIETNIVTVSKPYQEFVLSRLKPLGLKKNIEVIELGVNVSKFVPSQNDNKSMVFVGSIEERKNIKFLLRVFQKLQTIDAFRLTIIGDGPQTKDLLEYVKKNKIKNVIFLGRLSYEEVIKELPNHQYYVHTSLKESFSYALLEAKLSGLTTVAYAYLEVPSEFIDIKVEKFEIEEWSERISNSDATQRNFDKTKFSYEVMTKNTLRKIL